jgi:hypothetical protein
MASKEPSGQEVQANRRRGAIIGAAIATLALATLFIPGLDRIHSAGPANTGHDTLACLDCHLPAKGTFRQKIQARVHYWLGQRRTDVAVGQMPIDNHACIGCHERKVDNHAVDRFTEPRFDKVRLVLEATNCTGCHLEHNGRRVTVAATTCSLCHAGLLMRSDPLDVPHAKLVSQKQWDTCLGCHDFHGNHVRHVQTKLVDAISIANIEAYLAGGPSPYGTQRRFEARKTRP